VHATELDTVVTIIFTRHALLEGSGTGDTVIDRGVKRDGCSFVELEVSGWGFLVKKCLLKILTTKR
jgi:hypothetical protein